MRLKIAGALGWALGCAVPVVGIGVPAFRDVPPVIGAYTLRGGEVQVAAGIGMRLGILPSFAGASLGAAVGITGGFQVGLDVTSEVGFGPHPASMVYAGQAKLRLALGRGLDLGFPVGFAFVDRGMGTAFGHVETGAVLSGRVGEVVTVHAGVTVGLARVGTYLRSSASVDLDLLRNLKLVGEVVLGPGAVAVALWLRPVRFLDLELVWGWRGPVLSGRACLRL